MCVPPSQFQRTITSPLAEIQTPREVLDGAATLDKYVREGDGALMSGTEFYAIVGHLKRQHGPKGEALETELLKITRQKDKKLRLMEWVQQEVKSSAPPAYDAPVPVASVAPAAPAPVMAHLAAEAPPTPQARPRDMPAAGTPSIPRVDLSMARLDLGLGGGSHGDAMPPQRPQTARPATSNHDSGSQMAGLLSAPPQTARPATSSGGGAAAVADMSACLQSFHQGREHLKMSGAEYHGLVAWLKANGHGDIEDMLLKVRLLGDKKYQLAKYIREKCADLAPAGIEPAAAFTAVDAPTHMGPAQVLTLDAPVAPIPCALTEPAALPAEVAAAAGGAAAGVLQPAAMQNVAIMQAVAAIQQAGAPGMVKALTDLEGTMQRLEESFNFAVECMQSDMANAKAQIATLRAQMQGGAGGGA